jgi:hypothetical protein
MLFRVLHALAGSLRVCAASAAAPSTGSASALVARFAPRRDAHALSEAQTEALNITDACAKVRHGAGRVPTATSSDSFLSPCSGYDSCWRPTALQQAALLLNTELCASPSTVVVAPASNTASS